MGFKFFLYGIYDEGQKCFARFQNLILSKVPAQTRGGLYQLSCGLTLLHPEGESTVSGTLVDLKMEEAHWPLIDAINGYNASQPQKSLLLRKDVMVKTTDNETVSAFAYCLNDQVKSTARPLMDVVAVSPSGLIDRLTDRQQLYLRKLSQAKGREIVPVDMALYRELMSLELIVDKGRRLALTTLGQEVSLFL